MLKQLCDAFVNTCSSYFQFLTLFEDLQLSFRSLILAYHTVGIKIVGLLVVGIDDDK